MKGAWECVRRYNRCKHCNRCNCRGVRAAGTQRDEAGARRGLWRAASCAPLAARATQHLDRAVRGGGFGAELEHLDQLAHPASLEERSGAPDATPVR